MNTSLKRTNAELNQLSFVSANRDATKETNFYEIHDGLSAPLFLNDTLMAAMEQGASDIHFEPYADNFRIRFRLDGMMQKHADIPKGFGALLVARLKVVSGLDITEQRIPQGGRFKIVIDEESSSFDFRCSVVPTMHGETVVLRLLRLPENLLQLNRLGLDTDQITIIRNAITRQEGMILITGPTGSGKTVSLYTLIKLIAQQSRSIYTVEDPIEIDLNGINQINISDRISFPDAARTVLRQDPDVIMLGEMRDKITLDTAIKAAHTGHLVLSTLHASTAPKAIPRLRNLGIDPYNISSTVSLIINQRLLRCLDHESRERTTISTTRLLALGFSAEEIPTLTLYRAHPDGNRTGYKGRVGIFQVMPITQTIANLIAEGATDAQLAIYIQQQGIRDLRQSALSKVKAGITDIDEVERVLGILNTVDAPLLPNSNTIKPSKTTEGTI